MSFQDPYCRNMLLGALALAADRLAVFPCVYRSKEPATRRGFYDASTNPETIRRWFGGNFKRNLAVRTGLASGAWVLDVDNPDSLKALEDRYGPLPTTRRSQSSRGVHVWFKTIGIPIPSSASHVARGLDVKAESGYVIIPASVHPDGIVYRWPPDHHALDCRRFPASIGLGFSHLGVRQRTSSANSARQLWRSPIRPYAPDCRHRSPNQP